MLILRPCGKGNWATTTMSVTGDRATPILVRAGQKITLGDVVFRIVKVLP